MNTISTNQDIYYYYTITAGMNIAFLAGLHALADRYICQLDHNELLSNGRAICDHDQGVHRITIKTRETPNSK